MDKLNKKAISAASPVGLGVSVGESVTTEYFGTACEDIKIAAKIIADGGLLAFPTETVYGLGADAMNADAVKNVYLAKGRPSDNPMIVHISKLNDLAVLANEVTDDMMTLAKAFWPGPLTMIMKKKPEVPDITTGGLDTVAVRMPSDKVALSLIDLSACPIAAPSANLSGRPSPTMWQHVKADLDGRIDGLICGAACQVGIESTVVDMTSEPPMILRPGILTREDLTKALGKEVSIDPALIRISGNIEPTESTCEKVSGVKSDFKPKAPGMKYKHYAPKAEMIILSGLEADVDREAAKRAEAFKNIGKTARIIKYENSEEAARHFFAQLRAADDDGVDVIIARALEDEGLGFSVMNRMLKSAGYNIEKV